ncbi:hypothetical protein [Evansella cellulosilytica]|uniref:Uncharacterized protein n=1 Tax=Evansella cellulosilytica (strain ATCC 21833 / DSM 2522 / FERM P-1141 / JCM 9156 / N-4) TaxID=649639 RepID=E6TVG0_EVAC2|nr:hypothetical protein [Evansella cellulosilytica]ADU30977.1 hypothetical protein Bcell_2722 [Evansella cellulosilytica DSM 2522]
MKLGYKLHEIDQMDIDFYFSLYNETEVGGQGNQNMNKGFGQEVPIDSVW